MDQIIDRLFGSSSEEAAAEPEAEQVEPVEEVAAEEEAAEPSEEAAPEEEAEEQQEEKQEQEEEPAAEEEEEPAASSVELKCDNCHSVLTDTGKWVADADNHTFCDEACSRSYVTDEPDQEPEEMEGERTCTHCGNSWIGNIGNENSFCSTSCEENHQDEQAAKAKVDSLLRLVSKCSQCDKPLGTKAVALAKGPGKFCSVHCSNKEIMLRKKAKAEEQRRKKEKEEKKNEHNMEEDAEEEKTELCNYCKKPVPADHVVGYCSQKCIDLDWVKSVGSAEKKELCDYCKKLIPEDKGYGSGSNAYCSEKCFDLDQIQPAEELNCICPNCDKIVPKAGDRFCSLDCSLSYTKHRTCSGCGCNFSGKQFYFGSKFYCSSACCPGSTRATRGKLLGISSDRALMVEQLEKVIKAQIQQDETTFATKILEREYDVLRNNIMLEYRKIPDSDVGAKQKFIVNVAGPKMKKSIEEFRKQKKVKQEQKQKQKEEELSKKRAEAQKKRIEAVKRKREQQQEKEKTVKKQKEKEPPKTPEKKESAEMILF